MFENENGVVLTDENGNDAKFEVVDCIPYAGKQYVLLLPLEGDAEEVVILEQEVGGEEESFLSVVDEHILQAVFAKFKRKHSDVLDPMD